MKSGNLCHSCKNYLRKTYKGIFFGVNQEVICKLGFQPNLYCINCEGYEEAKK